MAGHDVYFPGNRMVQAFAPLPVVLRAGAAVEGTAIGGIPGSGTGNDAAWRHVHTPVTLGFAGFVVGHGGVYWSMPPVTRTSKPAEAGRLKPPALKSGPRTVMWSPCAGVPLVWNGWFRL